MNVRTKVFVALAICFTMSTEQGASAGFWARHPKLAKTAGVAAVGAATGGLGGVFLGAGLLHGAVVGAGTHVGFHELHEKWNEHKARQHGNL